ncbi:MAG: hypothetical protein NXY57DRAFT_979481 [Lentinula lateritia]|nr:MAG: hypothetical protein NXY57DRAFT_979481 [Lentinula lateritia]
MPPRTRAQSRANSEENIFFTTAQSFAPFSKSISAIGQPRCHNRSFGPATVPTSSTLPEAMEEDQQFEYSTLYTGDGQPVQVLTPRHGQPPVVAPARSEFITQIESPILQAIAHHTGKQPQRRANSPSPHDPPPHFDLDAGDHDGQDPPVDPNNPGADNNNPNNNDVDDNSGGLLHGGPGDPSGPGGPGGPHTPISPDISNKQYAMLKLLSGFKGSIETLGTILATLGRPSDSSESKSKIKEPEVNYTLSYLSGSSKEWFVPDILDPDLDSLPAWTSSFKALVKELHLKMKETKNIWKYNIWFNTLAASTNWDLAALKWAYGRGLAERIKDERARLPEPVMLADYCQEVLHIDNRYWKCEETKRHEAGKPFIAQNLKKGSSNFKAGSTNQQNNSQPSGSSAPFMLKPKPFNAETRLDLMGAGVVTLGPSRIVSEKPRNLKRRRIVKHSDEEEEEKEGEGAEVEEEEEDEALALKKVKTATSEKGKEKEVE